MLGFELAPELAKLGGRSSKSQAVRFFTAVARRRLLAIPPALTSSGCCPRSI
jgi:hypothetical protein